MALNFLISGSDVSVGKTMVGCALAFAFKVRGLRVGVMKPVQTGSVEQNAPATGGDASALAAAASAPLPLEQMTLYRYCATEAPAMAAQIEGVGAPDFSRIEQAYRKIATQSDVTLVEDTGGLAAPIDWQHDYADLAHSLGLEIVLVVANRPGFLNPARLTVEYASRRGVALRGFILNALDRDASATVQHDGDLLARATGARCLGTVRFKEPLALNIVEKLL